MTQESIFLLDTNAISDIIKVRSNAARREFEDALRHGTVAISVLTKAELLFGFNKRPEAGRLRAAFEHLCEFVTILPWTEESAESYSQLRLQLRQQNRTIDTMDLLIASQAHALGAVLVTRDLGFDVVAGYVRIINWAIDLK